MRVSFDVVVAGGGPAGSTAALELSKRGFAIALIERSRYETARVGETLPPAIRPQLAQLGIWERFLACDPLRSYGIESAWESGNARYHNFLFNPYGCGWHVDRANFDAMLSSAAAQAGTELIHSNVVSCRRRSDGRWVIEVSRGGLVRTVEARMLIDATGRKALLARTLGSRAHAADRLIGAVAFLSRPETQQSTLIEAVEHGWWYSAPLPGGRFVLAYMTDSDLWRNSGWEDLLRAAPLTAQRAGPIEMVPPIHIVSAGSVVRRPVTGSNWMAIGDAALAFDPLSGQGVSKSIETGMVAAAAIARHLEGDSSDFDAYQDWVEESFRGYLAIRDRFYSAVQRWPASTFWNRRAS